MLMIWKKAVPFGLFTNVRIKSNYLKIITLLDPISTTVRNCAVLVH